MATTTIAPTLPSNTHDSESGPEPKHEAYDVSEAHEPYEPYDTTTSKEPNVQQRPPSLLRTLTNLSTRSFDPGPPPDGGVRAWTQVACAHFVVASSWGFVTTFGAFQTYYTTNLHLNPSSVSWIGSLQTTLLFLIGVASGRAMDAGYFKALVLCGALLQVAAVMALSACTRYWQFLITQGVVFGLGAGMSFTPTMALVSTYFAKRRNIAIGMVASGSCTGGLLFPAIVREILQEKGFGTTVRVLGFIMLAFNIPALLLMRTRVPPRPSGPLVEWAAFREAPYTLFLCGMFFAFWALYFAFYYIGSFARSVIGLDYAASINLLLVMVGVGVPGRLIPNYLADRYFGPLQCMMPFTIVCAVLFFGWTGVRSQGGLYAFASIYGIASGAIQSLWPATLTSLTTDLRKAGTRLGMGFTIISFATLTGPPLAGALVAASPVSKPYLGAQLWGGCSMALAFSFLLAARVAKVGWGIKGKRV